MKPHQNLVTVSTKFHFPCIFIIKNYKTNGPSLPPMDRIHFSRLILTHKLGLLMLVLQASGSVVYPTKVLSYGKIIKEVKRNAATNINTNTCMTYVFKFNVIIFYIFFKINKHMQSWLIKIWIKTVTWGLLKVL